MAPEIILKQGHGKAVDWWSLGILIFEMLVGLPPFYNKNTRMAYEKLLTNELEVPSDVSPEADSLLRGLLARNPAQRLGSKVAAHEASHDGVSEIKSHSWFRGVDFDRVLAMEETTPFKPKVKNMKDVSNFAAHFTKERLSMQHRGSGGSGGKEAGAPAEKHFPDFHYVAPPPSLLLPLPVSLLYTHSLPP